MRKKIVLLLMLALVTFANAFKSPFMLDDFAFFNTGGKQAMWSFFIPNYNAQMKLDSPQTDRTYYRPLAHVIPQASYRMFGSNVVGHHAVNVFLLWLAACAVYIFLRSLRSRESSKQDDWFAFCAAALFTAHPINGVMVNYITASVFSAQVFFMLGGIYCLTLAYEGREKKEDGRRSSIVPRPSSFVLLLLSLFLYILALFCHETAVMLPLFALLVFRLKFPWRDSFRRVIPLLAVLGFYFIFRAYASPFKKSILYSLSILDLSWDQKIATVVQLLSWYFSKLFVPESIFLMWSAPFVKTNTWAWIAGALGILGAAGLFFVKIFRSGLSERTLAAVFMVWFALGLAPIAAGAFVTPYLGGLIEPHWFVFATVGFFALAALCLMRISSLKLRNVVFGLLLALLVVFSWRNNELWSDEIRYYQAWLKEAPGFKAVHYFLGTAYVRQGEYDKAYGHLKEAVLGRYKDWMVFLELGQIDLKRRDLAAAKEHIMKAYQLESRHSGVLNAVGALFYKSGEKDKARSFFEQSIKSNPNNLEPYMNLAILYKKSQQPEKAAEYYQKVLMINPGFPPAQKGLRSLMSAQPIE